jgi:hypothetical protein
MYSQADSGFITSAAGATRLLRTSLSVVTLHLHKENNETVRLFTKDL